MQILIRQGKFFQQFLKGSLFYFSLLLGGGDTFGFDNEKKIVDIFCEIELFFHFRNQK